MQIEQFIESIFPTQDPKKLTAANQPSEGGITAIETFFLVTAALVTLLFMGGMMVGAVIWTFKYLN